MLFQSIVFLSKHSPNAIRCFQGRIWFIFRPSVLAAMLQNPWMLHDLLEVDATFRFLDKKLKKYLKSSEFI